ncbi:hypothetical protein L7F22_016240 [Adiantum nelumboides]|nr:hypothetical protein [Adiantum nelumboides]
MSMPHLLSLMITAVFLAAWIIPIPCFSTKCKQKCGKIDIIFPFYLKGAESTDRSPVCGLPGYELECSGNKTFILLGGEQKYEVLDLRAGMLRISPLPFNSCSINNLVSFHLYNTTYRLCSHNMLQLYNCNRTCGKCIALPGNYSDYLPFSCTSSRPRCCENLESSFVNDSMAIQLDAFTQDGALSFHADYGLKLEWFLRGTCSCSSNAICNSAYDRGYTCKCKPPDVGGGYVDGVGCRQVASKGKWIVTPSRSPISNAVLASGIVTAAFVLGIVMVFGAVLFKKRRDKLLLRRGIDAGFRYGDMTGLDVLLSGLELFTYKQLDKATKGFSSTEKVGNGACGAVYVAKLVDGRWVAVKRLHHFNTQLGHQQTLNEVNVLSAVKHRNLVRLLGCCMESPDPLLVFEYVSNGTLAEHLQRERGDGLDWFTRLTIAAETADALAYLHTMDPPILHRDVKSRNILLDHDFNTKVADFGLSRMGPSPSCDGSHISTIPQGTPGYLYPDYHQNFHLSDKSDVYSFGVVLIELITGLNLNLWISREKKRK